MASLARFLGDHRETVAFLTAVGVWFLGYYAGRVEERQRWQRRDAARMRHKYGRR